MYKYMLLSCIIYNMFLFYRMDTDNYIYELIISYIRKLRQTGIHLVSRVHDILSWKTAPI